MLLTTVTHVYPSWYTIPGCHAYQNKECHLKSWLALFAALLFGPQVAAGQATPWLTDEQARDVAGAAIHSVYPEPCYSTYRNERLENFVVSLRGSPIVGNHLNHSVFFY